MDIRLFYVTEDRSIGINKYCIVVRHYDSLKKDSYTDVDYYLNEEAAYELENNVIPKHQLLKKYQRQLLMFQIMLGRRGLNFVQATRTKKSLK